MIAEPLCDLFHKIESFLTGKARDDADQRSGGIAIGQTHFLQQGALDRALSRKIPR